MGLVEPNVTARIQRDSPNVAGAVLVPGVSACVEEGSQIVRAGSTRRTRRRGRWARQRHGVVGLWLIVALPVLLLLLILLIEIGNIWLARAELENALETAALAAVKQWGDSGGADNSAISSTSRDVGVTYAAVNTVTGISVAITNNYNSAAPPNFNASSTGNLIFGAVTTSGIPWVFNSNEAVDTPGETYGVRARATVPVNSVVAGFGGFTVPTFYVSATATARYSSTNSRPELIRVRPENFL